MYVQSHDRYSSKNWVFYLLSNEKNRKNDKFCAPKTSEWNLTLFRPPPPPKFFHSWKANFIFFHLSYSKAPYRDAKATIFLIMRRRSKWGKNPWKIEIWPPWPINTITLNFVWSKMIISSNLYKKFSNRLHHLAATSIFRKIDIFSIFYVIWHPCNIFSDFFISNIHHSTVSNNFGKRNHDYSWYFGYARHFSIPKISKKLQSEIWPCSDPHPPSKIFFHRIANFLLFHLSYW